MSWNKVWDEVFASKPWGKYPSEEIIRFIAKNYYNKNRSEVKILELGCGPGSNLWYFSREGFAVYGIDGSEIAIKNAKERLDTEVNNWSGDLMVGDFSNRLPFNDGFFDAVVDVEAISCNDFQSSKDIYSEAHRVLKNNGKIFSKMFTDRCVGINNGKGKNSGFVKANKGPLKDLGHIRFTSYVDVLKLFGDFNLEDIELVARSSFLSDQQSVEEWVVVANKL